MRKVASLVASITPSFTSARLLISLAPFALACGQGAPASQESPPAAEAPKPEPAKPAEPPPTAAAKQAPTSTVDDPSFVLRLAEAGPYKAGEIGTVVVDLTPRGSFHVNQEYPIEITVTSDGAVDLPKAKLAKPDAAEFGEKHAKFDVPFTAKTAGALSMHANVKFAVCTEENCVPDERDLTLALAIQ